LTRFTLNTPTKLCFGEKCIEFLEPYLRSHRRVAIVCGRKSARVSGALQDVEQLLGKLGIEYIVIDKVVPNPSCSLIDAVAEEVWRFGPHALIAIGGGSAIDTAKLVATIVACGGSCRDYLYGARKASRNLPLYAINLTHGTGSEVDRYAVATIDETREKLGAGVCYPTASVDDPRYTLTLPRNQTLYTSIDALFHAIEAATSTLANPFTEMLSVEAARKIFEYLPKALEKPDDVDARYWLLYASMIAGIAIDVAATHIVHILEHVLSGLRPELPHGAGLGIVGPKLLEHIYRAKPRICAEILKPLDPSLSGSPEEASRARKSLEKFLRDVGFDEKLSNYGFTEKDLENVLKLLETKPFRSWMRLTPFEVTKQIIEETYLENL